jgi:uncharacterized protein YbaR (Trm112 family)
MRSYNLSAVRCPACFEKLNDNGEGGISCNNCGKTYPIVDGIPILLLDPSQDCALDLSEYDSQHPHDISGLFNALY